MKNKNSGFSLSASVIILLLLAGCSSRELTPTQNEGIFSSSQAVVRTEEDLKIEAEPKTIPSLSFEAPETPYWILGECAYADGFLTLYEQQYPDDYKQLGGEASYALRWQLFDANGKNLGVGDSKWSNTFAIHSLPFASMRAGEGTVSFDVMMPEKYSGAGFRRAFLLAVDDSALDQLGENPNNYRYRIADWYRLTEQGDARLECCDHYNTELQRSEQIFLLTDSDGEQRVILEDFDHDFTEQYYRLRTPNEAQAEGETSPPSEMKLVMDWKKKTAAFSIPKLTVTLDFSDGTSAIERCYTSELLETRLLQSADGAYTLYKVGEFSRFEGPGGCDYVTVGTDGAVHYLYSGEVSDELAFIGNDRVLANSILKLTFYDAATGQMSAVQPDFDFGEALSYPGGPMGPRLLTIGMAIDEKNQRILIAHRLNTFGNFDLEVDGKMLEEFPVSLAVFDFAGKKLLDTPTELLMHPFGKFTLLHVRITADEMGTATLTGASTRDTQSSVKVSYPIG